MRPSVGCQARRGNELEAPFRLHRPAVAEVPLGAVHFVRTGEDQGAKLVVFRVHTRGAREPVDIDD